MPKWVPGKRFKGKDVFIIGGGASLKDFDFGRLSGKATIGCNDAFLLRKKICKICFFSDAHWMEHHYEELSKWKGTILTHAPKLQNSPIPWLRWYPRINKGLHTEAIGYNTNSGASAINVALILGAKNIYLLGFDGTVPPKGSPSHWHNRNLDIPNQEIYNRFQKGFDYVVGDMHKFPGSKIFNLTPNSSYNQFTFKSVDEVLPLKENSNAKD